MRIGLIGPLGDGAYDRELRDAIDFLMGDANADQTVYLGRDDAATRVVQQWSADLRRGGDFLTRAAKLAVDGSATDIETLLEEDRQLRKLQRLRMLPPPPARAIEMAGDRIVLMVHDKSVLDEEDIANAHVIVFGDGEDLMLKRFGSRYFFCPGPLSKGKVGLLEIDSSERVLLSTFAPTGEPIWSEPLLSKKRRVSINQ